MTDIYMYFAFILSYLIGAIPTSYIISKKFYNIDIREHGSGNAGATNSLRVMGKKPAIAVLLLDMLKAFLPAFIFTHVFDTNIGLMCGLLAIIGHCFPVYLNFKGGKAIASTAGVSLAVDPILFLAVVVTFFGMIYLTKYVFIGSLSIGFTIIVYFAVTEQFGYGGIAVLFWALLVFLHRKNINNFKNGVEPTIKANLENEKVKKK